MTPHEATEHLQAARAALSAHVALRRPLDDRARALEEERNTLRARLAELETGVGERVPRTVPEWLKARAETAARLAALDVEVTAAWATATEAAQQQAPLTKALAHASARVEAAETASLVPELRAAVGAARALALQITGARAALLHRYNLESDNEFARIAEEQLPTPSALTDILLEITIATRSELSEVSANCAKRISERTHAQPNVQ